MIGVKCVKGYFDTKLNRHVSVNEELEVTEDRAKQLVKAKVAVMVVSGNEAEPAKAPKRTRAKKEA